MIVVFPLIAQMASLFLYILAGSIIGFVILGLFFGFKLVNVVTRNMEGVLHVGSNIGPEVAMYRGGNDEIVLREREASHTQAPQETNHQRHERSRSTSPSTDKLQRVI